MNTKRQKKTDTTEWTEEHNTSTAHLHVGRECINAQTHTSTRLMHDVTLDRGFLRPRPPPPPLPRCLKPLNWTAGHRWDSRCEKNKYSWRLLHLVQELERFSLKMHKPLKWNMFFCTPGLEKANEFCCEVTASSPAGDKGQLLKWINGRSRISADIGFVSFYQENLFVKPCSWVSAWQSPNTAQICQWSPGYCQWEGTEPLIDNVSDWKWNRPCGSICRTLEQTCNCKDCCYQI